MKSAKTPDSSVVGTPLRVLSWGGRWQRALVDAVIRPFEERANEAVEITTHVGLDIPAALHDSLTHGGRPPVSVVWSGVSAARRAAERGHTVRLQGRASALGGLRSRAAPEGLEGWPFVQPYVVHYVLVYRVDAFATAPRSWTELTNAAHRRKVALYPNGNGFFPVAQLLGDGKLDEIPRDMAPCWLGLQRVKSQVRGCEYSPALVEPLRRGDVTLAFRTLPNALGFDDEGIAVDWTAPIEGVPDTVDALWIPQGLDEPTVVRAAAFIDFALSAPVQEAWCARMGTLPVHPMARRPAVMDRARLPLHADDLDGTLYVSEIVKYRHQAAWEAAFARVFS